jgi:hypothetical protein
MKFNPFSVLSLMKNYNNHFLLEWTCQASEVLCFFIFIAGQPIIQL